MRRSELRRSSPLRRGASTLARSRLNPISRRRRDQADDRLDVRMALFQRDRGRCLLEGLAIAGRCAGPWTPHHILKASKMGAYDLGNLETLCSRHNGWVEDEPVMAHALGLVQRAGDTPEVCAGRRRESGLGR